MKHVHRKATNEADQMRQTIHEQISTELRNVRRRKGLTQADVARLANISQPTICRAERRYGRCGLDVVARIAAALNVTLTFQLK